MSGPPPRAGIGRRSRATGGLVFLGLASLLCARGVTAAPLREVRSFGSNPGQLRLFVHVPDDLGRRGPLVVVAHACFQSAQDVADNSGWVELADTYKFALLFPQTSTANEPRGGCFRTWYPEHQRRDNGEPRSVQQMVRWMIRHYRLDSQRVFIAGMSSGGLLVNVMLATYPETFAAGAPQSAYPYKCATSFEELKPCALGEQELSAQDWGELVRSGHPGYHGPRPRVSIWHGSADLLILPVNLRLQAEQWTSASGADQEAEDVDLVDGHVHQRYNDTGGRLVVETYMIEGMGHAVAVSPNGTPRCGVAGPYFADANICAALRIAQWFGLVR